MAILGNDDYQQIKKFIRNDPTARAEFKAWPLDKQTWKDAFQAMEDWFVNSFTSTPTETWKTAIDAVTVPATNGQAKQLAYVWGGWRYRKNP